MVYPVREKHRVGFKIQLVPGMRGTETMEQHTWLEVVELVGVQGPVELGLVLGQAGLGIGTVPAPRGDCGSPMVR